MNGRKKSYPHGKGRDRGIRIGADEIVKPTLYATANSESRRGGRADSLLGEVPDRKELILPIATFVHSIAAVDGIHRAGHGHFVFSLGVPRMDGMQAIVGSCNTKGNGVKLRTIVLRQAQAGAGIGGETVCNLSEPLPAVLTAKTAGGQACWNTYPRYSYRHRVSYSYRGHIVDTGDSVSVRLVPEKWWG